MAIGTLTTTVGNLSKMFAILAANPVILAILGGAAFVGAIALLGSEINDRLNASEKAKTESDWRKRNPVQAAAMDEANRKALGISSPINEAFDSGAYWQKENEKFNLELQKKFAEAKANAKKSGSDTGKNFGDAMFDGVKGSKVNNNKEVIDIFAGFETRSLLGVDGEFATNEIKKATGEKKVTTKQISIGNVSLPNVFNREDFASELDKLSLSFGV